MSRGFSKEVMCKLGLEEWQKEEVFLDKQEGMREQMNIQN